MSYDACKDTSEKDAEKKAGKYNGDGGSATIWRSEICGKWDKDLRCDGEDTDEEG